MLHAEKHARMITVSESAHALDALNGELHDAIPLPRGRPTLGPRRARVRPDPRAS